MPDVTLRGCRTLPLLSYLKTLGVFCHVAGADRTTRLWWNREGLAVLRSAFNEESLVDFFLDDYEPSPITSPWNGGSGYYPSTSVPALDAISQSGSPRLRSLAATICAARSLIGDLGIGDRIEDRKDEFLYRWRAVAPDAALEWLDAAVVLGEDKAAMNPLLGTGGNDGRFDFSGNFVHHLVTCLGHVMNDADTATRARSKELLRSSLFDEPAKLDTAAVGMFDPAGAGLPNSSSSSREGSRVNPWDFVLLIEGATLFAGSVARRLSHDGAVFPFTVRRIAPIGTSLGDSADRSARGETWLPVWSRPASLAALRRLLNEGRVQDGRRQSRTGQSMLRAVADVGVDRGVSRFERIVYAPRMGRNYVAVSAGASDVHFVDEVAMLRSADRWLDQTRRHASTSVSAALARVDRSAAEVSAMSDTQQALERWLLALTDAELAVSRRPASRAVSEPTHIRPLAALDRGIATSLPDTVEYRLALALAAVGRERDQDGLRQLLEPVSTRGGWRYAWATDSRLGPPAERPVDLLVELAMRSRAEISAVPAERCARLADISEFIACRTDDRAIVRLGFALTLVPPCRQPRRASERIGAADRLYAVTRLAVGGVARRPGGAEVEVRPVPEVTTALAAGACTRAARAAVRRLRADGLVPFAALDDLRRDPSTSHRIAAALAFPLHPHDRALLERVTLTPVEDASTDEGES